jgi:heme/copper-type cytochrome/quinol oxidase subunit 4
MILLFCVKQDFVALVFFVILKKKRENKFAHTVEQDS